MRSEGTLLLFYLTVNTEDNELKGQGRSVNKIRCYGRGRGLFVYIL